MRLHGPIWVITIVLSYLPKTDLVWLAIRVHTIRNKFIEALGDTIRTSLGESLSEANGRLPYLDPLMPTPYFLYCGTPRVV